MLGILDQLPCAQRVALAVFGLAAIALVVVEALSASAVPAATGLMTCGLLAVATPFLPRLKPLVVGAVGGLSITCTILCGVLPGRPDVTFGIVELFGLAVLLVRVIIQYRPWQAGCPAAVLFAAATLLPLRPRDHRFTAYLCLAIVVGMAFMTLLAMYLRLLDRRRTDAAELARQTQRLESTRGVHEFVADRVTAILTQVKTVRFATFSGRPPSPRALDEMLAGIETAGSQVLASMRAPAGVPRIDPDRPHQTLGDLVTAAAADFAGPPVRVSVDGGLAGRDLPGRTLDVARQVVQESLSNVLRHTANVRRVDISVRDRGPVVEITVANDGTAAPNSLPSGGYGLVGLTERVAAAGGRLSAGPTRAGWVVTAVLPA